MSEMNRRDLCVVLPMLAALGSRLGEAQAMSPARPGEKVLSESKTYRYGELPVKESANGESRAVVQGVLVTGEPVELHETTLLPGHSPHPPHRHRHSEFMLIRDGDLEFTSDGNTSRVGPGGVIFAASNTLHGLKNVGEQPANYFVIAIGRESGVTPVKG